MVDVIATFSMLLDIPAFNDWLDSARPYSDTGTSALSRGVPNTLSARIRSIVRVCRILRLMRLVHMFQQYQVRLTSTYRSWETALKWPCPIAMCVVWPAVHGLKSDCNPMAAQHSPASLPVAAAILAAGCWLLAACEVICLSDCSISSHH